MKTPAVRLLWCLALICGCNASTGAPVEAPPLPAAALAEPIALGPGGSETIALGSVIFRIATGTAIGNVYQIGRKKVIREDRWDAGSGRTREFDVTTTDRMRQFGYSVLDPTQNAFATVEPVKARYQLGAIVSRAKRNFHFRYTGSYISLPDEGYGIAELDVEFQILDQSTAEIIFRRTYTGHGTDVGRNPGPLIPAFANALDHALADPEFANKLRKPAVPETTLVPAGAALATLQIPGCQAGADTRLPDNVDEVIPAVVTLRIGGISGTGIVVSPRGHVLTAAHLVTNSTGITATLSNGMEFDATVLRVDTARDLAVLQLPGRGHSCVPVSASRTLKVGEDIFVVGSPLGKRFASSVTRGVLSAERTIDGVTYLQTDASISPGSSGGPLLDANGRVQAIVSAKIAGPGVDGLAFGVPIEVFISQLAVAFD